MFYNKKQNEEIIVGVFSAIKEQDEEAIRDLFSKHAINFDCEFDKKVDELFDYIQGELVTYDDWGGPSEDAEYNTECTWVSKQHSYDIVTTEQKYRFAIKEYTIDSANPDNVGIYSLYVIKTEDDPYAECAYGGDGTWEPGIHFNVVFDETSE